MSDRDLIRWNARYRERSFHLDDAAPDRFLIEVVGRHLDGGRVLDVAGGSGRNAVWLAGRGGWDVTLVDGSIAGVGLAEARAERGGVAITTAAVDLVADPFPPGPWDLIVCVAYLQRSLFPAFAAELAPGGSLLVVHPTIRNLERFARPSARHLLEPGELVQLLDGWSILESQEGWGPIPPGRHEARCLARRPP